jgi:hypothetical protein
MMVADQPIRAQLVNLLTKGQAHMTFDEAIAGFPIEQINVRPPNVEYTFWHLLEHLRLCQWDILDYIRNPNYKEPKWPDGLWPSRDALAKAKDWQHTADQFRADLAALVAIVQDPETDLTAQIPHGYEGHNILREILVVADHNAYHIGELGILRQVVGLW